MKVPSRVRRARSVRVGVLAAAVLLGVTTQPWTLLAQAPEPSKGVKFAQISPADMKEWLTYLASDELLGRQIYTEGYGMAVGYIAEHLKAWGVKPLNADGTYFQPVKQKGYRVTRNSTVTVQTPEGPKTFKHGDHVTFSVNSGGNQTVNFTGVEFVGYGLPADLQGRDLKGKLVVTVPNMAPVAPGGGGGAGGGGGRGGRGGGGGIGASGAAGSVSYTAPPAAMTAQEQALLRAQAALVQAQDAVQSALRGGGAGAGGGGGRGGFGGAAPFTQAQIDVLKSAGLTDAQITNLQPAAAAGRGGGGRGAALPTADITSLQKVDNLVMPAFQGDDAFYEALFAAGPVKFADIKAKAAKGETIQPMSLPARVSVSIDNTFDVISEQISHNVVGMIEGIDPKLKDTYVLFGAHLDHVGYSQTGQGNGPSASGCRSRIQAAQDAVTAAGKVVQKPTRGGGRGAAAPAGAAGGGRAGAGAAGAAAAGAGAAGAGQAAAAGAGRGAAGAGAAGQGGRGGAPVNTVPFDQRDFISNGADDDGSGSTSLLAVAKAFATGPKPKRSLVFVWHTGEEAGLNGSRYNADFPVVPLDKVQVQLNMDMVGRDDCDNIEGDFSNTVFLVGDDRISTDLHNMIITTNSTQMTKPLTLDYEMNDPNDPESVYTRSDHYSYAAKGIPIAFFTTGLHPDYHRVTDTADKILYPKMARIAQLVYQTGYNIANTEKVLERDNKGPRAGYLTKPEIIKK